MSISTRDRATFVVSALQELGICDLDSEAVADAIELEFQRDRQAQGVELRKEANRLDRENARLSLSLDSMRAVYTDARVEACSARLNAYRMAAGVAKDWHIGNGDRTALASDVGIDIHDAIMVRARQDGAS